MPLITRCVGSQRFQANAGQAHDDLQSFMFYM